MRLCLLAMGDARGRIRSAETIWRDPETQNEAVRTDAVLKQFQAGVIDLETAQEQLGYSPEQVRQMRERRESQPDAGADPSLGRPPRSAPASPTPSPAPRGTMSESTSATSGPEPGRAAPCGHHHIGVHDAGPGGRRDTDQTTTTSTSPCSSASWPRRGGRRPSTAPTCARSPTPSSRDRAAAAPGDRLEAEREAIATRERDGRSGWRPWRPRPSSASGTPTSRSGSSTRPRSSQGRRDAEERGAPARRRARPLALPRPLRGRARLRRRPARNRSRRAPT